MNIRKARREDSDALCALERRTPLVIGDTPIHIERKDFFETHELQEQSVVMLAEDDGEIIGVCAGALQRVQLAGEERLLNYIHHERIAPEHQRQGIGGRLTTAISDYWKEQGAGEVASSYWFIAEGNERSRNFAERSGTRAWPSPVVMFSLSAEAGAGELPPRIGAGPTFDIVRLINRTHAGKEMFRPYEHVDFGRRLSASFSYGWGDIYGRFRDGRLVAVAGIWQNNVADYGHEPGAEEDMVLLLRSLLPVAQRFGGHGLTLFADPESALYRALEALPHFGVPMLFYAPRIEPPQVRAPIYVDPAYF